jgi:hypothetical protein
MRVGLTQVKWAGGGESHDFHSADRLREWGTAGHVPVAELARRRGVGPVVSADDLARPGLFESDEELAHFLADLYFTRQT